MSNAKSFSYTTIDRPRSEEQQAEEQQAEELSCRPLSLTLTHAGQMSWGQLGSWLLVVQRQADMTHL